MPELKNDPIRDALDAAAQKTAIQNQTILEDPFNKGGRIISAKQLDVDRFATYSSKTYGKLGFDPFKDNNKVYNANTHWSEDIGRATRGMFQLAGVGFQDTFGFGLTAEKDNWKNFDEVMKNYSSTRGGYTQFWSNTMLSSGYTVGILGAIAAEEIGLALTTGGLGNISSAGLVGVQVTRAFDKLAQFSKGSKTLEKISKLGNADEAAKFFSMANLGKGSLNLVKKLNPISESVDFLKNSSKLDDLNAWQKLAVGSGAIARDARKFYMTHSESKLEAELAKNEFVNKQLLEGRFNSPDGELSDKELNNIKLQGENVYNSTYMGNLGLIYATNAITFDNMFKSMRYSNKMFSIPGKFTTALGKDGVVVKAVKNFSSKRALAAGKKAIVDFSAKEAARDIQRYVVKNYKVAGGNLIKKGLANSMEGVQELGQDVVSNSVQKYYGRNHVGEQVRGGFLNYLYEDVGTALKGTMSKEGRDTFGSGFFMGTLASPFGSSIGYLQKQLVAGGAKAKMQYLFDRENYIKQQKTKYKESLAKAKELTIVFNAQLGSYLEHTANPLVTQAEYQEAILGAIKDGNKKGVEDKKHDSFQHGVKTMLKNNSEVMFTDFLDHMVEKFTPEQMNQAMGRTDITEQNAAEYKQKLQKKVATVKSLRKNYDEINEQISIPIRQSDIDRLDITDPAQAKQKLELTIQKFAWDNLKDELLFNKGKIVNKAERMIELQAQLNKETNLSPTEIQAFISKKGLSEEIKILKTQVDVNKELNLKGDDLEKAKAAELKLEALTKYQKALDIIDKEGSSEEPSPDKIEDAYSDLFEAYHEYRSVDPIHAFMEAEPVKRAISRKSFDAIVDYLDLNAESEALQSIVNTLLDPSAAKAWIDRNAEMMMELDKNKEKHIANQLYAFEEKAESSKMLTILQEAGVFFELDELDDLVSKGIMPSKIYNIETNKLASKEEYQEAQRIISQFYKNLKGKTLIQNQSRGVKQSLRYTKDTRIVKDLIKQYGIKLGEEIDLSDPIQLERLLRKLKKSEFLTNIDKELLDKVSDSMPSIMFVDDAEFPISLNEDGVFLIDIRYAGSEYKNVAVNFETLIISALTQAKLNDNLEENEDLKAEVENLMQQAKDAFSKKYPNLDPNTISIFNSPAEFLSESLNNTAFQSFLGNVTDTVSGNKESLWKSLMAKIMKAFKQTFDKSVLQRAVSLANMALDESITDNINEKVDDPVTEEEEKPEPLSSVEKNGFTLSEVVPGIWQVTDKEYNVNAFDTKAEAEKYINEKLTEKKQTDLQKEIERLQQNKQDDLDQILTERERIEKEIQKLQKGKGFKDFLTNSELSPATIKVMNFILNAFPKIAGNVDFITSQEEWDSIVGDDSYQGFYASDDETGRIVILLNPKSANDETVVHEVIHAFTQVILDNPSTQQEKEYVEKIKDLFEKFKTLKDVESNYNYIYNDIAEFITYTMTNTKFQDFLNKNEKTKNAWEKIKAFIAKLFGIPTTSVEKVIRETQKIVTNTDYSNIRDRVKSSIKGQPAKVNLISIYKQLNNKPITVAKKGLYAYSIQRTGAPDPFSKLEGVVVAVSNNGYKVKLADGTTSNWINYKKTFSGAPYNMFSETELTEIQSAPAKPSLPKPSQNKKVSYEVHVGGIENGYTESKESEGKGVGDIRGEITKQKEPYGTFITNGSQNTVTEKDRFVVVYSKVDFDGNPLTEASSKKGSVRDAWVTASVKISDTATEKEIEDATFAAQAKLRNIMSDITGGKFVLSKINTSTTVSILTNIEENDLEETETETILPKGNPVTILNSGFFGQTAESGEGFRTSNDDLNQNYGTPDLNTSSIFKDANGNKIDEFNSLPAYTPKNGTGQYRIKVKKQGDKKLVSIHFQTFGVNSSRSGGHSGILIEVPVSENIDFDFIDKFIPVLEKFKNDNFSIQNGKLRPINKFDSFVKPDFSLVDQTSKKETVEKTNEPIQPEEVPEVDDSIARIEELKKQLAELDKKTAEIEKNYENQINSLKQNFQISAEEPLAEIEEELPTEEQTLINEESKLKTKINQKRALLDRVNEQIASSRKIQLRKRMKLDKQKTQLLIDLKDLQAEYDSKYNNETVIAGDETIIEEPVNEEPIDLDEDEFITENTKFNNLPKDLQKRLIDQYRFYTAARSIGAIKYKYKTEISEIESLAFAMFQASDEEKEALDEEFSDLFDVLDNAIGPRFEIRINDKNKIEIAPAKNTGEISDEDVAAIEKLMVDNMAFTQTIIDYNLAVEPELVVELTEEEMMAKNAEAIEIGQQLKQKRLDQQKAEARARSRARKQAIVPVSAMEREQVSELLKTVLKNDFELLTKADLTYLIDNLLNDSKTFRFRISDVLAFVSKKKLQLQNDSQLKQVAETFSEELAEVEPEKRAEAILGYQKDIFEEMSENSTAYNYGLLSKYVKSKEPIKVSYNGKKYSFTLTPTDLKALVLYNKELFNSPLKTKDAEESFLIRIHQIMQTVKGTAENYKKDLKFKGTAQEVEDEVIKLFFDLMNKGILLPAVVKAVNYALYNSGTKLTIVRSNALSGSIYTLEERSGVALRKQPKNKLAQDKETIADFVYYSGVPVTNELWQEAVIAHWFSDPKNRVHPDFITKNVTRGKAEIAFYKSFISNKSKFKTADGLADTAASDFNDQLQDAALNLQDAVIEIFANYKSISEMVTAVAERIKDAQADENYEPTEYESEEDFEKFVGTSIAEEAMQNLEDYNKSLEYEISIGNLDLTQNPYSSLTPSQQLIYDQAAAEGLYESIKPEEPVEEPEEDDFLKALAQMQAEQEEIENNKPEVEKQYNALLMELKRIGNTYDFINYLVNELEAVKNDMNLKLFLAAYRVVFNEDLNMFKSESQKNYAIDKIMNRIKNKSFIGMSLLFNDTPVQIMSYDFANKTADVVDINTGEILTVPMDELFKSTNVFEQGDEYTKLNLNTVVNDQEIDYIKEAYQDIFNNFTASVSEFEKLDADTLNSKVLEQLTKCK